LEHDVSDNLTIVRSELPFGSQEVEEFALLLVKPHGDFGGAR
jgi:hypothetical protein